MFLIMIIARYNKISFIQKYSDVDTDFVDFVYFLSFTRTHWCQNLIGCGVRFVVIPPHFVQHPCMGRTLRASKNVPVSVFVLPVSSDDMPTETIPSWCGGTFPLIANSSRDTGQHECLVDSWRAPLHLSCATPWQPPAAGPAIFMHHGTTPHSAHTEDLLLHREAVNVLDWPSRGPYLNLIENLWYFIKRWLNNPNTIIRNMADLRFDVQRLWTDIP